MRNFFVLALALCAFASCQKTVDPQIDPLPVDSVVQSGCRIVRMESDSLDAVHTFGYDEAGRIKFITSRNRFDKEDTMFLYYDGNSSRVIKSDWMQYSTFSYPLNFRYDSQDRLIELGDEFLKTQIYYVNNRVDSTLNFSYFHSEDEDINGWGEGSINYFRYNQSNAAVFYGGFREGPGGAYMEYTGHKNNLRHLAPLDYHLRLMMEDIFPAMLDGYADEYLLSKYEGRSFYDFDPGPDVLRSTRYEYQYEFDEKENLTLSRVSIYDNDVFWKTITRHYYYECK